MQESPTPKKKKKKEEGRRRRTRRGKKKKKTPTSVPTADAYLFHPYTHFLEPFHFQQLLDTNIDIGVILLEKQSCVLDSAQREL
jgi:hypothetical protein